MFNCDSRSLFITFLVFEEETNVSRKSQYKNVKRRTIEILQRTHIFKAN